MQQGSEHMAQKLQRNVCSADGDCGRQGFSDKGSWKTEFQGYGVISGT
jgi:hypothetical protein